MRFVLAMLLAAAIAVGGVSDLAWADDRDATGGDGERSAGTSLISGATVGRIDRDDGDDDDDDDRRDRASSPISTVSCAPSLLGVFQYCPPQGPALGYVSLP